MLSEGHSDAAKYGPLCGIDPAPKEAFTLTLLALALSTALARIGSILG